MGKKHDEANVVRALNRKSEIKVDMITGCIEVVKEATNVGIRTWGKIDFLVNHCGYYQIFVTKISKFIKTESIRSNEEDAPKARFDLTKDTKKILKMKKL